MSFFRSKLIFLLIIFVVLTTSGFGCKLTSQKVKQAMEPITLTYWRVWDGPDAFEDIIAEYQKIHPFVKIEYRKLRYSEYEKELLEAFAEDRGPDILSLHNTWTRKYQTKLAPMPAEITMAYPAVKGTIKKEVTAELRTTRSISLKEIQENFVDVVYDDAVIDGQVYALPLSVDTLAMYYNKDLLNNAGLPVPPEYWNRDFQQAVKKLTKQDSQGRIIQSGVALGGSTNIERYSDILSVLMMQNGAVMIEGGTVKFNQVPPALREQGYNPGYEALRFYTDFANPAKEVYSWNSAMENSVNLFAEGKLAIMFGYSYHLPIIKAQAPKLNFGIAKLPQIEGNANEVNFANYWMEAVSKKSAHVNEAWDFIQFATKADQAKTYLEKVKKPTALRSLINSQLEDVEVGTFAAQVLTAKSWYKGRDSNAMELIFADIIDSMVAGKEKKPLEPINIAASRVQQTL